MIKLFYGCIKGSYLCHHYVYCHYLLNAINLSIQSGNYSVCIIIPTILEPILCPRHNNGGRVYRVCRGFSYSVNSFAVHKEISKQIGIND